MESYFYQFIIVDKENQETYFKYFADEGISTEEIKEWEQDLIKEMNLLSCKFVSQGYER